MSNELECLWGLCLVQKKLSYTYIKELIGSPDEATYTLLPDERTTVCQVTLPSGFTVNGISACVSSSNFDLGLGRTAAYNDAIEKAFDLEAYALRKELHARGDV